MGAWGPMAVDETLGYVYLALTAPNRPFANQAVEI